MSSAMTPERWKRLSELFERALAAPDDERETLIGVECADDSDLAAQLRSLLEMQPRAEGFLENAQDVISPLLATPGESDGGAFGEGLVGRRVAGYRVIKQIGEGGMGVVYLAEQLKPRRTVALKVIRAGLATPSAMRRFEHEAHILGRLQHPGIAQIYEAGASDESTGVRGFFAMEYVRGRPLTEHAKAKALTTREKLELTAKIADTIQYAHQKGIIHRDLKPSNILVDESGQPKVLDFGVARATDSDMAQSAAQTGVGQLIGTLPYMSPEQVVGDPAEVDTRSDIYALGVTLYEMLTGRLPHDLKSRSAPEAARIIRDEEPARLSAIDRALRGDVETIVQKAIEKNKAERYQSAAEFAADIRRYLAGEPVEARRDSAMYILKKQLRRYRGAAVIGAIALLALVMFATYATWQSGVNRRLAARESDAKREAIAAREIAEAESRRADAESERLRRELYFGRIGYAEAALAQGDVARVRRLLAECPEDLRGWEWGFLARASEQSDRRITARLTGWGGGAFASAAPVFAIFRIGEEAAVRDVRTGEERFRIAPAGGVMNARLSDDGRLLTLFGSNGDIYLQDLTAPDRSTPRTWKKMERQPLWAAFDPAGEALAIIDHANVLRVFDVDSGDERRSIEGQELWCVDIGNDGRMLAGAFSGGVILIDGDEIVRLGAHDEAVREVAIDPTGRYGASTGNDGAVRVWDLEARTLRWVTRVFKNKAAAVAWSRDGSQIYAAGTEASIEALDAATGASVWRGLGHTSTVLQLCGLASGELVSTGIDGEVRWWTPESVRAAERVVSFAGGNLLRSTPVGEGFLIMDWSGAISFVREDGGVRLIREGTGDTGFALSAMPSGFVASIGQTEVAGYGLPFGDERWRALSGAGKIASVSVSPDGAFAAVTVGEGSLFILSALAGTVLASHNVHPEGGHFVQWGPDNRTVYTAGIHGMVRSWNWDPDARALTMLNERAVSTHGIWAMSVSPDGRSMLIGGDEQVAWLIDTATLEGRPLVGHQGAVYASCFHPDGRRVVTGGFDNTTRVWETATGAEVVVLRSHKFAVHGIAFDPTGAMMLTIGGDGLAVLRRGGAGVEAVPTGGISLTR